MDDLHTQLSKGSPERALLDHEPRYINWDIVKSGVPFKDDDLDGILMSHVLEHMDAQEGVKLLKECHRCLKPGGVVTISVPDAAIFRSVDREDRNENWERLWGVVDPNNPIPTWRSAALFFEQHKMVFTDDSLWCFFREAGFEAENIHLGKCPVEEVNALLNRHQESLIMHAIK